MSLTKCTRTDRAHIMNKGSAHGARGKPESNMGSLFHRIDIKNEYVSYILFVYMSAHTQTIHRNGEEEEKNNDHLMCMKENIRQQTFGENRQATVTLADKLIVTDIHVIRNGTWVAVPVKKKDKRNICREVNKSHAAVRKAFSQISFD